MYEYSVKQEEEDAISGGKNRHDTDRLICKFLLETTEKKNAHWKGWLLKFMCFKLRRINQKHIVMAFYVVVWLESLQFYFVTWFRMRFVHHFVPFHVLPLHKWTSCPAADRQLCRRRCTIGSSSLNYIRSLNWIKTFGVCGQAKSQPFLLVQTDESLCLSQTFESGDETIIKSSSKYVGLAI